MHQWQVQYWILQAKGIDSNMAAIVIHQCHQPIIVRDQARYF
jgi:hypothetical protein